MSLPSGLRCEMQAGFLLPGMAVFKPFSGLFCSGWYNLSFLPGNAVKSKIRKNQVCDVGRLGVSIKIYGENFGN